MTDVPAVLANIDTGRLIELVRRVCRIPSILGDEGPLAAFLHDVMRESGFEATGLQPVLGDRPNALGELSFGAGPRVVFTGHMDTKPVSHGWTATEPFSGELIDGTVYGHGIMDMKAALACQIVAMEALRDSGLPLSGTLAMAAVCDHMGDQTGSIVYFDTHHADMAVLGELSGNEIFLGHRGRYYFDITVLGTSAHTCHKPLAVNANLLAAHAVIELDGSRLMPPLGPQVSELFGAETFMSPGRIYGRVRDPGRLPPAARRQHRAGPRRDRPLPGRGRAPRPAVPRVGRAGGRQERLPRRTRRPGRDADDGRGPQRPRRRACPPGRRLARGHRELRREGADGHLRPGWGAGVLPE